MAPKRVLFVCLGNICRSPIAEAVFKHIIKERQLQDQWECDSCAIGSWHIGRGPDRRAMSTLREHDIEYEHFARQIHDEDFETFDFIFGMDRSNIEDLKDMAPASQRNKIELLGDYNPEGACIIEDPYYDRDSKGFEEAYQRCYKSIEGFLSKHT